MVNKLLAYLYKPFIIITVPSSILIGRAIALALNQTGLKISTGIQKKFKTSKKRLCGEVVFFPNVYSWNLKPSVFTFLLFFFVCVWLKKRTFLWNEQMRIRWKVRGPTMNPLKKMGKWVGSRNFQHPFIEKYQIF